MRYIEKEDESIPIQEAVANEAGKWLTFATIAALLILALAVVALLVFCS